MTRRGLLWGLLALLLLGGCGPPGASDSDRALVLDGEAWVDFGDPGDRFDLLPGGERTFALWVRYDRPQYHAKILDKTEAGVGEKGFSVFVHQYSTSLGFWHQGDVPLDPTGFAKAGTTGTRRIGDGDWHHVALVQRDTLVEGWVDGRLDFVENVQTTLSGLAHDAPLVLGWNGVDVIRFAGSVDELTVWDRALSGRELRRLMYDRPSPDAGGLAGYWPMDGPSGDVVRDITPFGQDGRGVGLTRAPASRPLGPPFTERPVFYLLVALAAMVVGWGILRLYGLRLTRQKRTLERQVEERVQDLSRTNAEKDAALALVASQARRLEEQDRVRRRFFANISHEFRTPLSLIIGPLSDLANGRDEGLEPELRDAMRGALRNGRRLRHLTEQLLDLARLESGALRLEVRALDLAQLLGELVVAFRPAADAGGIRLEADLPDEPVYLRGDPERLETVFSNLLSNALRFTPSGKAVRASLEVEGGEAVAVVQDEGPGIPYEDAVRIFERFYQTAEGAARGGTGIGLALVRELTELHGGTVALDAARGGGARFRVTLPVGLMGEAPPAPPAPELSADGPRVLPPSGALPRSEAPVPDTGDPAPDDEAGDRKLEPLILVVEDHDELRGYIAGQLRRDFRVAVAADGEEALEQVAQALPDVVVSDVMMPGTDGLELLSALRSDPETEAVPVILLTARDELQDRLEGFRVGADDYLAKPFEPLELAARIHSVLELRHRLRRRLLAEGGVARPGEAEAGGATEADDPTSAFRAKLRRAVEEHLADPLYGVSELAASVAMERTGLYRRMMEELGTPPSDFMREVRMEAASRLLEEGNTVAEVAYAVGYESVSSFSRRFKERFQVTPGRWEGETAAGMSGG